MLALSSFGETLPLQSPISSLFSAGWGYFLFEMLVNFFSSRTFMVFKYSQLPLQIPCSESGKRIVYSDHRRPQHRTLHSHDGTRVMSITVFEMRMEHCIRTVD